MSVFSENISVRVGIIALLAVSVVYIAALANNTIKSAYYIGKPTDLSRTITISGEGKEVAIPDVAIVSLGYMTEKKTVSEAQRDMTQKINALIAAVKQQGIEAKDIKTTNYSVYPQYDWIDGRQVFRGYQASQSIEVKMRNFDTISPTLELVGTLGLNQVGGLQFTIDDIEAVRQKARLQALANAKEKADALARVMGVRLGKVISFSESGYAPVPPIYYDRAVMLKAEGVSAAPAVEGGSEEIIVNASVTYELN